MSPERHTRTGERLTPLFEHASAQGPVQAVRVDYAPGGYTAGAHRHPAGAHVHVLSGAVYIGLDDERPKIVRAGESLYQPPARIHSVSANASDTEPASLIAFFVLGDHERSTVPAAEVAD
jgi:quercetin dioxygenase-like cupin family protein